MKNHIQKIISGGQTGADTGGLRAAKRAGIPTGGCAPRGYLTENGANYELGSLYGLYQSDSDNYPTRTRENVAKSDATIIFSLGKSPANERGSILTKNTCDALSKPYLWLNPFVAGNESLTTDFVRKVANEKGSAIVLNIAGNRQTKCQGIAEKVEEILYNVLLNI